MYLSHIPAGEATAHISTLNLTTGVYTSSQEIDIAGGGGGNKRMLALTWTDDTLYGFALGEDDAMYSIDPATGVATLERAKGAGDLVGEAVLGADTTADGTIYILGFPDSEDAVLYTTDPNGSTTKVADITGLGGTEIAENLAIATLLTQSGSKMTRGILASLGAPARATLIRTSKTPRHPLSCSRLPQRPCLLLRQRLSQSRWRSQSKRSRSPQ